MAVASVLEEEEFDLVGNLIPPINYESARAHKREKEDEEERKRTSRGLSR